MEDEDQLPSLLDAEQILRFFYLSDEDLHEVRRGRGDQNRLGYAIQLCVLRWRGHFLKDPAQVPWEVLEHTAQQLGLLALPLKDYVLPEDTRVHQRERLRQYLGFRRCGTQERQELLEQLIEQAQVSPKDNTLRTFAGQWLAEGKIIRPGKTTLTALIQTARERGLQRVYERLTDSLSHPQRETLESLLIVNEETGRSRLEELKSPARQESSDALLALIERLKVVEKLNVADITSLRSVHPAIRQMLAAQGFRHEVWTLRRFPPLKRLAIVLCFIQATRAEITDAIIEMQDKLILRQHTKARLRRQEAVQAGEQARKEALEAAETVFRVLLDESIEDSHLRSCIFDKLSREKMGTLVVGCKHLRVGGASHLGFLEPSYPYIRRYAPQLLEAVPFTFSENSESADLAGAVEMLTRINKTGRRKLDPDAPTAFLSRRWREHVEPEEGQLSRPYYELAVLTSLNEGLKSGDVTVAGSRRFTDFEDYLIPKAVWETERQKHYQRLGLPLSADAFLAQMGERLSQVTDQVEKRIAKNTSLTIDADKGKFHLAALQGEERPASVKELRHLLQSRMPRIDLVDLLIDMDNATNFLGHFLNTGNSGQDITDSVHQRRNLIATLIAVGCNIGAQRMAAASGVGFREISQIADWSFTEENLKAASVELVNFASSLPMSRFWGRGDTCSADGMRFHVPVNILAADYSSRLGGRGVTLMAHTADNFLRLHHRPIPCRLREATFCIDGLMEHESELDPRVCYTDTHGFTEVVMATATLLGFELAPRIRDVKDQTLYKMDRSRRYPRLDPLLTGTIQTQKIQNAWDEVVRIAASIQARRVSASLILHRLGSYARKNSIHQALAEIGRICKTIFILTYIDDETLRRHIGRELNKGEASHQLSRFLCFGKEGTIRGREFDDQVSTFSCLAVLHNAVVAWNTRQMEELIPRLRQDGFTVREEDLAHVTPLMRRHINPFGRYHFDLNRIRRE